MKQFQQSLKFFTESYVREQDPTDKGYFEVGNRLFVVVDVRPLSVACMVFYLKKEREETDGN